MSDSTVPKWPENGLKWTEFGVTGTPSSGRVSPSRSGLSTVGTARDPAELVESVGTRPARSALPAGWTRSAPCSARSAADPLPG